MGKTATMTKFCRLKSGSSPPGMRCCSYVSYRSRIGRDVADHAKKSSRHRNWYVNETDLFKTSLGRLTGT